MNDNWLRKLKTDLSVSGPVWNQVYRFVPGTVKKWDILSFKTIGPGVSTCIFILMMTGTDS
jgi:hypothetical protein